MVGSPLPLLKYRPRKTTQDIIIHDSHTSPIVVNTTDYLRAYGRELGLLDVGYHYVIERTGYVQHGRHMDAIGSHTPGFNLRSIGICLAGGADEFGNMEDNFEASQFHALDMLVEQLLAYYGPLRVWGHTELQRYRNRDLQCPAFDMRVWREANHIPHPERNAR